MSCQEKEESLSFLIKIEWRDELVWDFLQTLDACSKFNFLCLEDTYELFELNLMHFPLKGFNLFWVHLFCEFAMDWNCIELEAPN